ncbi:hypothetical protein E2C01_019793 [Portunus trituberculatus]|uniref:Peptidase C14 caspase domain-containing protein n=1 Tax=Portunus trituberculatus TaxID=210409 RepID=A0A5B7DZY8_PORTR|nr:hypothetical protein [Portunus trituberculatus]
MEVASTPTYTDGGALGMGYVPPTGDVSSDGGSEPIQRLILKFEVGKMNCYLESASRQAALRNQNITPVRRELHLRLLKSSMLEIPNGNDLSTLESNFSDEVDQLSSNEEDVLEFTEIFERLKYEIPKEIRDRFNQIVTSKKIPFRKAEGSKKKTFFVYAENKILMKVCNSLSALEVYQMYMILSESKVVEEDDAMKDFLSQPCVSPEALENVKGLKDVAFYYFILTLMRKKMINRLYTHKLYFLLENLVVWFMGHGSKTYLNVKEGQIHRRLDLIEPFTEIEWFFKKPKLFFIQACAVKDNRKRFSSSSGQDLKSRSTQMDSVGWKAPAGIRWQEKYADYTDVSNINCFADTLISYATMWYQPAARDAEGELG